MSDTEAATSTDAAATTSTDTSTPPAGTDENTPKTYDEKTVKDLRKESAGYRTSLREAETTLASLTTERDTLSAQIPTLTKERDAAVADATRYRVALEAGLPLAVAERLRGTDEDSLKADAESLKALLGSTTPPLDLDQGTRTPPPTRTSVSEALRVLARGE